MEKQQQNNQSPLLKKVFPSLKNFWTCKGNCNYYLLATLFSESSLAIPNLFRRFTAEGAIQHKWTVKEPFLQYNP